MFLVTPQKQVGHFPLGQFPPHESAKAIDAKTKSTKIERDFINIRGLSSKWIL
jgi:hypothetical protein